MANVGLRINIKPIALFIIAVLSTDQHVSINYTVISFVTLGSHFSNKIIPPPLMLFHFSINRSEVIPIMHEGVNMGHFAAANENALHSSAQWLMYRLKNVYIFVYIDHCSSFATRPVCLSRSGYRAPEEPV